MGVLISLSPKPPADIDFNRSEISQTRVPIQSLQLAEPLYSYIPGMEVLQGGKENHRRAKVASCHVGVGGRALMSAGWRAIVTHYLP